MKRTSYQRQRCPVRALLHVTLRSAVLLSTAFILCGCLELFNEELPPEPQPIEDDQGSFTLHASYRAIRSYPGGSGVFVVSMRPGQGFAGIVRLTLEADSELHAQIDRYLLDEDDSVAEIRIAPMSPGGGDSLRILFTARHNGVEQHIPLAVDVMEWDHPSPGAEIRYRNQFIDWLADAHPELNISGQDFFGRWMTYPQHLIVEHWTFLSREWEMRICFHVMFPPDDWSKMRLRCRGCPEALIAVHRDTKGNITQIPVEEYPTFYGY